MPDVLGYLTNKGLALKPGGGPEWHTTCVFCDEDPSARGRLYINVDTEAEVPGLYYCHKCEAKGNLVTLKRHFGDEVRDVEVDANTRSEILQTATAYYQARLVEWPAAGAYLTGTTRGLTSGTIDAHQLGYAPMEFEWDIHDERSSVRRPRALYGYLRDAGFTAKDILATGLAVSRDDKIHDSLAGMITIPYHSAGNVTAIRGRTWPYTDDDFATWAKFDLDRYEPSKAKYKTCGGTGSRLFNSAAVWDATEVFVAEGEMDAMVLEQEGFPAVGVPGANAWQDSWNGYFTDLRRVWLVFDRDPAGEQGATKMVTRFGAKVRRVHLSPEGIKCDPTAWFYEQGHTAGQFAELVDEARRGGLLVTVVEAINEFRTVQAMPGLKFGWEAFDLRMRPGLQAAQVMVVLAKTGVGKTIFILNMMHRVLMAKGQQDKKILFISLEQTRGEWWDRARRIHRFYDLTSTEAEAEAFWQDSILLVDRNRLTEEDVFQILDDFEYQMGQLPDLVVLDYLGYWARSFKGDRYERTSDAVMSIKAMAKEFGIPWIVPHQVNRAATDGSPITADFARDSGVIEETADFVMGIWSEDNAAGRADVEKSGVIHLGIGKSRHGGRGDVLAMQWAPLSLVMVPEFDPFAAQARNEHRLHKSNAAYEWADAVKIMLDGSSSELLEPIPNITPNRPTLVRQMGLRGVK